VTLFEEEKMMRC